MVVVKIASTNNKEAEVEWVVFSSLFSTACGLGTPQHETQNASPHRYLALISQPPPRTNDVKHPVQL